MYREPHPYVCAYILAGGLITHLAAEVGVTKYRVGLWLRSEPVSDADVKRLWPVAASFVVHQYNELREKLKRDPNLAHDRKFRRTLDDLDLAHRLCFGQSLLDFLLDAEKTGLLSHIPPSRLDFFLSQQGKETDDGTA